MILSRHRRQWKKRQKCHGNVTTLCDKAVESVSSDSREEARTKRWEMRVKKEDFRSLYILVCLFQLCPLWYASAADCDGIQSGDFLP